MNQHGIQGGQGRSDDDVEATAGGLAVALLTIAVVLAGWLLVCLLYMWWRA